MNFKTLRATGTGPVLAGSLMWDGREPSLEQQAIDATRGHAQADRDPTPAEIAEIVAFQTGVYSAQICRQRDRAARQPGRRGWSDATLEARIPQLGFGTTFTEYANWSGLAGKLGSIARGQATVQHAPVHDQERGRVQRSAERRQPGGAHHLQHLPQHLVLGRRFSAQRAAQHRHRRWRRHVRRAGGRRRSAPLHAHLQQQRQAGVPGPWADRQQRSGPGADHRQVRRHRQVHRAATAGTGGARALLPRRVGTDAGRGRVLLQPALRDRSHRKRSSRIWPTSWPAL